MKKIYVVSLLMLCFSGIQGQDLLQIVKGKVSDQTSNGPLAGASIQLRSVSLQMDTTSNESGTFSVDVPTGRYQLVISFTGYKTLRDEVLVIAGRETVYQASLEPTTIVLQEIEVSASPTQDLDLPGLKSLSIEKTVRIPANFFDPVRIATAFPGVIAANDQSNAIVVRGNSPNGLLWRLNGLDIVNPNHLSNAGTLSDKPAANGGGVNILSAQMLDRTDFYMGAFPVNYGNALSGVVDMGLREGNREKYEYTAQASLIGLDASAEGPLSSKHNSSFLANYRYSTVGLLGAMGVDFGGESITFQDFSFNLTTHQKNGGTLTFFGLGGLSKNDFLAKDSVDREEDKDAYDIQYKATTYALGVLYNLPLKNKDGLSAGLSFSATEQTRQSDLHKSDVRYPIDTYLFKRELLSGFVRYNRIVSENTRLELGANISYQHDTLYSRHVLLAPIFNPQPCTQCDDAEVVSGLSSGVLFQPYINMIMALSTKVSMTAGFRYVNYSYNNATSAEPRIVLYYYPSAKSTISISGGLVSQQQLPVTYFTQGNHDLGFTKARHFSAKYQASFRHAIRFSSEVFFQQLFDVPVEVLSGSTFSVLNLMENTVPTYLIQDGQGQNYGVDVMLEKPFFDQHYFILGGSYYESNYTTGDGKQYSTRFNGNYTLTAVYGKEWVKSTKNRTIGLNTRLLYLGGLRENPVDLAASQAAYETVYDTSSGFSNQLKDYMRIDLKVSFRKNKPGYTRTFAIDIQNLLGQKNEAYHQFDNIQQKVITKYQLGLIPVIVYRIDF
ncbi:MAG: TonB-dependent receptor [Cyclobacteriaceae bacterium]|nr:TonB-dependent receptor [Cyclobacteriaceae bacterium]